MPWTIEYDRNLVAPTCASGWLTATSKYAGTRFVTFSKNISLCSYLSASFVHSMPFWHALPYTVPFYVPGCGQMCCIVDSVIAQCEYSVKNRATQNDLHPIYAGKPGTRHTSIISWERIQAKPLQPVLSAVPQDSDRSLQNTHWPSVYLKAAAWQSGSSRHHPWHSYSDRFFTV